MGVNYRRLALHPHEIQTYQRMVCICGNRHRRKHNRARYRRAKKAAAMRHGCTGDLKPLALQIPKHLIKHQSSRRFINLHHRNWM